MKSLKYIVIFFILFLFLNNAFSKKMKYPGYSKGPLYGKNMYLPFLIYYNFPSISAQSSKKFDFTYHGSFYYINDFFIEENYYNSENNHYINIGRDYESLVFESGASFFILKNLQIGIDMRSISYYGGFLDGIIETYHNTFGFPNASREYVDQNQIEIDLDNNNNVSLSLDHPTLSFGDIDTWIKYTFYEKKWISIAMLGVFKIPTGSQSEISGSGYPDFAVGVLADFRPIWILSFYLQGGVVFPLDFIVQSIPSCPYPMFNGLAGIELNPLKFFSLIVQFNFKTSPLTSEYSHWSSTFQGADYLSLPQINLLVGFVFKYKDFRWQFYFEEDTFTNAGADLTINLSFSHTLHFRKII
jgi:hypothetical protein